MSGPIRQVIGPTKARLRKLIETGGAVLSASFLIDAEKSEQENLQILTQNKFALEILLERISTCVELLRSKNSEWSELMRELEGPALISEEEQYAKVTDDTSGFVVVMLEGVDQLAELRTLLSELELSIENLESNVSSLSLRSSRTGDHHLESESPGDNVGSSKSSKSRHGSADRQPFQESD